MSASSGTIFANLRQLISIVDELRDIGLNKYINLPRICVVGTQSAGKSSLLEAIVGIDFLPRGQGVVTRRPLEMRLVHRPDMKDQDMYAVFGHDTNLCYTDFSKVTQEIEKMTDEVAGTRKGIVDDPITMEMFGYSLPDLTLIDLPGITRVPLRDSDQTEDIEKMTRGMVMRYAKDARTVILAVIPANQDISTADSLQIARKVDPRGIRTIGVITKIDIMDKGTDAADMLQGNLIPLRLGFIGVKLRSHEDIAQGLSIAESLNNEEEFFLNHKCYTDLPRSFWGIKILTQKLSEVLYSHIKHCLPEIRDELDSRRQENDRILEEIGPGSPQTDQEIAMTLWTLISDFANCFTSLVSGNYTGKLSELFGDEKIVNGSAIRSTFFNLLEEHEGALLEVEEDTIIEAMERFEGDKMPGFTSQDTFQFLLTPYLKRLKEPTMTCLDDVTDIIESMIHALVDKVFVRFPELSNLVCNEALSILKDRKDSTRNLLQEIVLAESSYIFTNDENYLVCHSENKVNTLAGAKILKQKINLLTAEYQEVNNPAEGKKNEEPEGKYSAALIYGFRVKMNDYYAVVVRSIRETVPRIIGQHLLRTIQIEFPFKLHQVVTENGDLKSLFNEDRHLAMRRKNLQKKRQVLNRAKTTLHKHMNAWSRFGNFDKSYTKDVLEQIANDSEYSETG